MVTHDRLYPTEGLGAGKSNLESEISRVNASSHLRGAIVQPDLKTAPKRIEVLAERREPQPDNCQLIKLSTNQGEIQGRYYQAEHAKLGAIWVGGISGGWDSPANGLYPQLCQKLRESQVSSLRVRYRYSTILKEALLDTLTGIAFLAQEEVSAIALIGHSFGGAVVIQAAMLSPLVQTVITLASQSHGADLAAYLAPQCSLLLLHGTDDQILSPNCSRYIYAIAQEPKRLILYPGARHSLDEVSDQVSQAICDWTIEQLTPKR